MKRVMCTLAALMLCGIFIFVFNSLPSADAQNYTCKPDGTYVLPSTGPAKLTPMDIIRSDNAEVWLRSMIETRTKIETTSSIELSQDYASSYTGSISGTYVLNDRTYPVIDANVITDVSPATIPNDYVGSVTAKVTMTPEMWRWIIQLYKRDAVGNVSQVPVQALASEVDGSFTINLPSGYDDDSQWLLGVLDANDSYAPYGPQWPDPTTYDGLELQHLVITDTFYYWSTIDARTDGNFTFPNSNTGNKVVRLVETSSDEILAEYVKPTGLVRSYQYSSGETGFGTGMEERSFVYDQGLALLASLSYDDPEHSKLLADGLLTLQTSDGIHEGGFVFAAPQMSPSYTDALYRTGAHAIATDALLAFIEKYEDEFDMTAYISSASKALDFVDDTLALSGDKAGLYLGGYGNYSGDPQVFDANYSIPWASTEHNIDIWHMLVRASRVLDDYQYSNKASNLKIAIMSKLYNYEDSRLNQGYSVTEPDTADPLDVNSWGAIMLYANNETSKAQSAIDRVELFRFTRSGITGYAPFYDAGGYPGASPTVWYEGSFGVVMANLLLGNYADYRTDLDSLSIGQEDDGSFRYATDADEIYEIGISKSVAGTAWYILATTGSGILWNTCNYQKPATTSPNPPSKQTPDTSPVVAENSSPSISQIPKEELTKNTPEQSDITKNPTTNYEIVGEPNKKIEENNSENKKLIYVATISTFVFLGVFGLFIKLIYKP